MFQDNSFDENGSLHYFKLHVMPSALGQSNVDWQHSVVQPGLWSKRGNWWCLQRCAMTAVYHLEFSLHLPSSFETLYKMRQHNLRGCLGARWTDSQSSQIPGKKYRSAFLKLLTKLAICVLLVLSFCPVLEAHCETLPFNCNGQHRQSQYTRANNNNVHMYVYIYIHVYIYMYVWERRSCYGEVNYDCKCRYSYGRVSWTRLCCKSGKLARNWIRVYKRCGWKVFFWQGINAWWKRVRDARAKSSVEAMVNKTIAG